MPSRERQTADAIAAAINAQDTATIISLRTPDCLRVFRPASLNLRPQSNAAYHANLDSMKSLFSSFEILVSDVIEGTSTDAEGKESKKIVMFVEARGETPVGEYRNEYVWKMGFEAGGERVNEWVEFVDVGMAKDFFPKLQGELARRAQAAQEGAGKV